MSEQTSGKDDPAPPGGGSDMPTETVLRVGLKNASEKYRSTSDPREQRDACLGAVAACLAFARTVELPGIDYSTPLVELLNALMSLNEGHVSPLLEPVAAQNRPPAPLNVHALRATAAAFLTVLEEMGALHPEGLVAEAVNAVGHRIPGRRGTRPVGQADVKRWRRTYAVEGEAASEGAEWGAGHYADLLRRWLPRARVAASLGQRKALADAMLRALVLFSKA